MLVVDSVTKVYPTLRTALDGVSFECGAGVFGLLGPNGAGKSTLLRILAGGLDFEAGRATLDGRWDVRRDPRAWRERLGLMPQSFDFVPHVSAREYLEQCALLSGQSTRALRPRMDELLERVGLADAARRRARDFSRGMKQRLTAAAAFLCHPRLVLLDEPTAGLDPRERVLFRELVTDLSADTVTILSTHIVPDIERCCDHLAVLARGRVLFCGPAAELAARAAGRTWDAPVATEAIAALERDRRIVRLMPEGESCRARVVGDPPEGAVAVEPTLEDGYILLANEDRQVIEASA